MIGQNESDSVDGQVYSGPLALQHVQETIKANA